MSYIAQYPESFVLYLGIILLSTVLAYLAERKGNAQKRYVIVIIILLSTICGFRGELVGADTAEYLKMVRLIRNGYFANVWGENGYKYLIALASYAPIDNLILIITAYLTIGLTVFRLWELRNRYSFTIAIYVFTSFYYFACFNIVRQCLAMAITFWSTRFLSKKKFKTFIITLLLAMACHSSAAICAGYIVIYLFAFRNDIKLWKRLLITISAIAFSVFVLTYSPQLQSMVSAYARFDSPNMTIMPLFRLLAFVLIEFLTITKQYKSQKQDRNEKEELRFTKLLYLAGLISGFILAVFSPLNADRVALYYRQYEMNYYGIMSESKNLKMIKATLLIILSSVSVVMNLNAGRYGIMPYTWYQY